MKGAFIPNADSNPQEWEVLDNHGTRAKVHGQETTFPSKFAAKAWVRDNGKFGIEYEIRRVR